ncbi:MAG TPA: hypothetical protein VKV40_10895 [Ktedonobacteraceae bacterium]|nr:hypothetical protein [Ktedonobacteraceae bacterium]
MQQRWGCGCSPLFWICVILALALVLLIQVKVNHWNFRLPVQVSPNSLNAVAASLSHEQTSPSSYVVTGQPSISADFIDQVLAVYHSPAAGTGQAMYDLGVQYGIDPVFALAFFWHESTFGKYGMAAVTRSLGNLRCVAGYACYQGFAAFASWQTGYEAWYQLIRSYVAHGLKTVAQIVPTYAPSSDGNTPVSYIAAIEQAVNTWRTGEARV